MKRELGLLSATNLVINSIIGAGIFISPAVVLKYSGSVGVCLIIWVVAGIISLLGKYKIMTCLYIIPNAVLLSLFLAGALAYSELATVVRQSGGGYIFLLQSYGPLHRFWGPLPATIFGLLEVLVLAPAASAIFSLTSAEYLIQLVLKFICINTDHLTWVTRLIAISEICKYDFICNFISIF